MNCCLKKDAVLREWRENPNRPHLEIAVKVGCHVRYASLTIQTERLKTGLPPRIRPQAKKEAIQKPKLVEWREPTGGFSVEEWQANRDQGQAIPDRVVRGLTKQQTAIYQELQLHPKQQGESASACSRRVAAIAGCAPITVQQILHLEKTKQIGIQKREEERAKLVPVLSDGQLWGNAELEIVRSFRGWRDTFFRLKIVLQTYQHLAKSRECVYAESFLSSMLELCEKGEFRAGKERDIANR